MLNHPLVADLPLPIAIVGLGVSGNAAKAFLIAAGIRSENLLTFDQKSPAADYQDGKELLLKGQPRTLVVSPGVALSSPWLVEARKAGILITSELSLASRILTTERIIAVTGSIGKSTTTSLLGAALEKFCPSFFVGGNLGTPLAIYALQLLLGQRSRAQWIALELSSYQLENFAELKAEFSLLTYLTSNHLERYSSKDEYFLTKWRLHQHTTGQLILNKNGGELHQWIQPHLPELRIPFVWSQGDSPLVTEHQLEKCQILGAHNLDNIAMAAEVVRLANWPPEAFVGLRDFRGLPHRVENLGVVKNIRFINDSKATTMESVLTAVTSSLESLPRTSKLHLLLGGKDKNLPWENLAALKKDPRIQFYFFGHCRALAKEKTTLEGDLFLHMAEACHRAIEKAQPGDSILLSPGGTSLDEFKSFEDRGEKFCQIVEALKRSETPSSRT